MTGKVEARGPMFGLSAEGLEGAEANAMSKHIDAALGQLGVEQLIREILPVLRERIEFDTNEVTLFIAPFLDQQMESVASKAALPGQEWQLCQPLSDDAYRIALVQRAVLLNLTGSLMGFDVAEQIRNSKKPIAVVRLKKGFEAFEFDLDG